MWVHMRELALVRRNQSSASLVNREQPTWSKNRFKSYRPHLAKMKVEFQMSIKGGSYG